LSSGFWKMPIVEVREVATGQPGVGVDQRLNDPRVDLVANVGPALQSDHVGEARALRRASPRASHEEVARVLEGLNEILGG
jgi:hypothetical protein